MKLLPLVSAGIFASLLAACGGPTPVPVTLASLTLSGVDGPLPVGSSAKLNVSAVGTDGLPFSGTPVFSSSDTNAIVVSADGSLTIRHLTLKPVTITVTEGEKSVSKSISIYGLDAAGGTYQTYGPSFPKINIYSSFIVGFRDINGKTLTDKTNVIIKGPVNYNLGQPYIINLKSFTAEVGDYVDIVSGSYTATLVVDDITYSKSFNVDAKSTIDMPKNVKIEATRAGFTASGDFPLGALGGSIDITAFYPGTAYSYSFIELPLPLTEYWQTPIPAGSYDVSIYASTSTLGVSGSFPDFINASDFDIGKVEVN